MNVKIFKNVFKKDFSHEIISVKKNNITYNM